METKEHPAPNGAEYGIGKRRLAIAYTILVGAPLLTLIVILKVGGDTRAPRAVGGVWDVQTDLRTLGLGRCGSQTVPGQTAMIISQSGRHLEVTLGGSGGTGSVEDLTVNAFMPGGDDSCHGGPGGVYLRGNVEGSAADERMIGMIGITGRADYTEVSFLAIRRPASPRVGP